MSVPARTDAPLRQQEGRLVGETLRSLPIGMNAIDRVEREINRGTDMIAMLTVTVLERARALLFAAGDLAAAPVAGGT